MIFFIILILGIIGYIYILYNMKRLKYGNLTLVTGGVKTGKTELCVALVMKQYKRQLRKWRKECRKAKRKYLPFPEKPLIYSNMPIGKKGMEYVPLTNDMIERKVRFAYGSVVYFNEVTFIAGSKDIKDEEKNNRLLELFKLCAHETKGGYFFIDTQAPQDMHYSIKRSLSTYYTIYKRLTLPIFSLLWVRENIFVDGENTVAMDNQIDTQDKVSEGGKKMYFLPILNKWWKYYDRYAYSYLTDHLQPITKTVKINNEKDFKVKELLRYIKRGKNEKA